MHPLVEIRQILRGALFEKQLKNKKYSLRSLARHLDISAATLSQILSEKRTISEKMALKILKKLKIPQERQERIIANFNRLNDVLSVFNKSDFTEVELEKYFTIADWYCFAILSLVETEDFESAPEWVAKRLNITAFQAKDAIERLLRLELLKVDSDKKLSLSHKKFITKLDITDKAIQESNRQYLSLAEKSLKNDDVSLREITTMLMAIDPRKLPEAKTQIREFMNTLSDFLEHDKRNEVYAMSIQLFPVSKR